MMLATKQGKNFNNSASSLKAGQFLRRELVLSLKKLATLCKEFKTYRQTPEHVKRQSLPSPRQSLTFVKPLTTMQTSKKRRKLLLGLELKALKK